MKLVLALVEDLDQIDLLYKRTIATLNSQGLMQWEESYPNRDTFVRAIKEKTLFLIEDEQKTIGAVILNEEEAKEWVVMPWRKKAGKHLVIHAFIVDPTRQGKGYGQKALNVCEAYGLSHGYGSIRLDAFSENKAAIYLYEKNNYLRLGSVEFDYKPKGHQTYFCYEKILTH